MRNIILFLSIILWYQSFLPSGSRSKSRLFPKQPSLIFIFFSVTMSISTDDNTSAATQSVTIDQIIHINTPLSIKLNDSNFLSWKSQVLLIIEGYDLVSYLLNDPPDPATRNDQGETVINSTYLFWKRQDKLLHA
jgi:hypothetical protein